MADNSLLLWLAIILICAKLGGAVARRIGQPAVIGELGAGLLLGGVVSGGGHPPLAAMAQIGVVLLMFLAGLETDLVEMRRAGWVAAGAAVGGVALPLAAGTLICRWFGLGTWESLYVGTVLTATSVSISAQTLLEMGRLSSREGSAILGAAVIDDVLGLLVLSFVLAAHGSPHGAAAQTAVVALTATAFLAGAWLAGRVGLKRLMAGAARLSSAHALTAVALAACFVYAWTAERFGGMAAITGAYLAGALLTLSPQREQIAADLRPIGYALFIPLFFVSTGASAQVREISRLPLLVVALAVTAVITKLVGCGVGARLAGFSRRQALRVGVGMVSRGEVAIITSAIGLKAGLLHHDTFSALILVTLATTLITPVLLNLAFGRRVIAGGAMRPTSLPQSSVNTDFARP